MPITHELVGGTNNPAYQVSKDAYNAPHDGNNFGYFNVMDYGATGDGSTDDTTAIQAAVDAGSNGSVVLFPAGVYKTTAPIDLTLKARVLIGAGMRATTIYCYTPNIPIVQSWDDESGVFGLGIREMTLQFVDAPTGSTTQQYGMQFRAEATGAAAAGNGFYNNQFEKLKFNNCYIGIGQYTTGSGTCPVWGSSFRDLVFTSTYGGAIRLANSGNAGQPNNLLSQIFVLNSGFTNGTGLSAIYMTGATGTLIDGLDIEDWYNNAVTFVGGEGPIIDNVRFERQHFTSATVSLFYLQGNSPFVVTGFSMYNTSIHSAVVTASVFELSAAIDQLILNGGVTDAMTWVGGGSGVIQAFNAPTGSRIYQRGLRWGFTEYQAASFNPSLYARVTDANGLVADVDVLPTASATYRGRRFRVLGGAGVADVVSECSKNSSDAYVWVTK